MSNAMVKFYCKEIVLAGIPSHYRSFLECAC